MIEAGVVVVGSEPIYWHLPEGRSAGSIPDSRDLWLVLWELRREERLGFAHSHPGSGVPAPSHEDVTTFSAFELGLGRCILWWITSSDCVILARWQGPGKYEYNASLVEEPEWAAKLRDYSKEKENG